MTFLCASVVLWRPAKYRAQTNNLLRCDFSALDSCRWGDRRLLAGRPTNTEIRGLRVNGLRPGKRAVSVHRATAPFEPCAVINMTQSIGVHAMSLQGATRRARASDKVNLSWEVSSSE